MKKETKKIKMPDGVKASDVNWKASGRDTRLGSLLLYHVGDWGWCIATLPIAKGTGGYAARTYAVKLDGKQVRVGNGPHVDSVIRIYLRKSNIKRLQKYVDLYKDGVRESNQIRDRISTRRMRRYF